LHGKPGTDSRRQTTVWGGNVSVGANDGYIAAMADVLDDAVLTDNVEDFEALGVPVETY
jgi:hypothetical protein